MRAANHEKRMDTARSSESDEAPAALDGKGGEGRCVGSKDEGQRDS